MKKAIMMLALLALPFAIQAQTKFHDVEANEATGPVKCIKSSVMGHDRVTNFTKDGKMEQEGMKDVVYDADGYMQSAKMEAQGMEITIKYTWENGKVMSQSMETSMGAMKNSNVYDEKGVLIKQVMDFGGQEMETPFSDYKFDDKGNWISRKTSMMGQDMEQTRTIEYYE
ncbi:MAG: hypothetical protein IKX36_08235 [Prevotella sp.]|nr:hypothetical protein [Prevotella sp.]